MFTISSIGVVGKNTVRVYRTGSPDRHMYIRSGVSHGIPSYFYSLTNAKANDRKAWTVFEPISCHKSIAHAAKELFALAHM